MYMLPWFSNRLKIKLSTKAALSDVCDRKIICEQYNNAHSEKDSLSFVVSRQPLVTARLYSVPSSVS